MGQDYNQYTWMVGVTCMTFNHALFIVDALNGFSMQQTEFPYICMIVDDASTDGEPELIRQYLHGYFDLEDKSMVRNEETDDYILCFARHKTNQNCYFAVLWLKYNHRVARKSKVPYIAEWSNNAKYMAVCEGDDYWIDKHKLQSQVAILECFPKCTMVCSRTKRFSQTKRCYVDDNMCYPNSRYIDVRDIILKGGLFISFCSVVYRNFIRESLPEYCVKCHVGDYPLFIMAALKGQIYYIDEPMSVYRIDNHQSWVGRQKTPLLTDSRLKGILSEVRMLQGFQHDYPQYAQIFAKGIEMAVIGNMPSRHKDVKGSYKYNEAFKYLYPTFSKKNKMVARIKNSRLSFFLSFYYKIRQVVQK